MESDFKGKRNPESGYALLAIFAMAATAAVLLYMQLPRQAFEAQREREQQLIDRGRQFSRAIELYVRKYNRFPVDLDALEKTQNLRFLRRKYKDPLTGKDEWRLIHVGPGGVFTDSLVYNTKKTDKNAPQTFIAEMQGLGAAPPAGGAADGANLATRRRPRDGVSGGGAVDPGNSGANPISGPVMVLPDGRIVSANIPGLPGATGYPALPGQNGLQPGIPGQFPGQNPGQPGLQGQNPGSPTGFPPGFPVPGMGFQPGQNPQNQQNPQFGNGFQSQPNAPPQSAANLINQILTTPRPGGFNGLGQGGDPTGQTTGGIAGNNTGTPLGQGMGGQVIGGGIGGVASKVEREGIKIFKQRAAYNEWEFVYDISKDPARGGGRGGIPTPQTGNMQGTQQPNSNIPGTIPTATATTP